MLIMILLKNKIKYNVNNYIKFVFKGLRKNNKKLKKT